MRRKEIILEEVLFYLRETDFSYQQIAVRLDITRGTLYSYLVELGINYKEIRLQRKEKILKRVEEIRKTHKKKIEQDCLKELNKQSCLEVKNRIKSEKGQIKDMKEKLKLAICSAFVSIAKVSFTNFDTIVQEIGQRVGLSETEVKTFLKEQGITRKRFELGFYKMTKEEQKEFLEEEARVEDEKTKTKILKLVRYSMDSLQNIADSQHVSVEKIETILQEKGMSVEDIRNGVYDSDLNL